MQINVKFFASLREELGSEGQTLESADPMTVARVWQLATNQPPPDNLLCSRNLKYADWDELVEEGDEVAFFPPVTGG
ncbi:MAG: MoaD/ThiS family protein [bacterium]